MITINTHLIIDKVKTGQHINDLLTIYEVTPRELQHYLGFSCVQSIYHWMNGSSLPSIDNLVLLSHLWSIPINDILRCKIIKYEPGFLRKPCTTNAINIHLSE